MSFEIEIPYLIELWKQYCRKENDEQYQARLNQFQRNSFTMKNGTNWIKISTDTKVYLISCYIFPARSIVHFVITKADYELCKSYMK